MTEAPKLTLSQLVYQLDGQEPEICTPHNRSFIAWDETRGKRKWPSQLEAPFMFQTFIVWHHLSRTGKYPGNFDQFREECVGIEVYDDEEDKPADDPTYGDVDVDPTQPAATPISQSLLA